MEKDKMIYIAHRGYSGSYPENTKIAFQKAVDNGFKGVEFDVHITKDNKAVIIHDETPERMTLGKEKRAICDLTLNELRQCDLKGNFKVEKQTVMTLEEFCKEFAHKFELIIMELKTDKQEYDGIEKISWNIVKPYLQRNKAKWIMSSFNIKTCTNFMELKTDIDVALLYVFWFMIKDLDLTQFSFLHPAAPLLLRPSNNVKVKKDVKFNTWTINTKEVYDNLLALNNKTGSIMGMITNFKIWEGEFGKEQILNANDQKRYSIGLEYEAKYLKTL